MTTITTLPKVVFLVGKSDAGEYGNATCPHCGADCRYTYHFICEDGTHRAAAKVCFSMFPKHRFAAIHEKLLDKSMEFSKKGWKFPEYEQASIDAIEKFAQGTMAEWEVNNVLDRAFQIKRQYMKRRGYRR